MSGRLKFSHWTWGKRRKMMILQKIRFMFCGYWERFFDGFYCWTFFLKFAFLNSQFHLKMSNFYPGYTVFFTDTPSHAIWVIFRVHIGHFWSWMGQFRSIFGMKQRSWKKHFSLKVFSRNQNDHNPQSLQNIINIINKLTLCWLQISRAKITFLTKYFWIFPMSNQSLSKFNFKIKFPSIPIFSRKFPYFFQKSKRIYFY